MIKKNDVLYFLNLNQIQRQFQKKKRSKKSRKRRSKNKWEKKKKKYSLTTVKTHSFLTNIMYRKVNAVDFSKSICSSRLLQVYFAVSECAFYGKKTQCWQYQNSTVVLGWLCGTWSFKFYLKI